MNKSFRVLVAGACVALFSTSVMANDLEGAVESIDVGEQSFTVQGIRFMATPETDYDDGLSEFGDIKEGQKVEVDFIYRDGRHVATEVELED